MVIKTMFVCLCLGLQVLYAAAEVTNIGTIPAAADNFTAHVLPPEELSNSNNTVIPGNGTYLPPLTLPANGTKVICYLAKTAENGTQIIVNNTRAAVGPDEYPEYKEICTDNTSYYLLPGTLASLVGSG